MNTEATATPAPLASGARAPSRPQATRKATTLIAVAQIQPPAPVQQPDRGGDGRVGFSVGIC
jgi:hypothetical protein